VHNLSPVQSLKERRSGGRESIRGPQKLRLCEGSVYCQGVQSNCGPPSFGIRASSTILVEHVEI
jgi:hypothetical protein